MAEISTFLNEPGEILASANGHGAEVLPLPRVDPARGVFITSRGTEIELSNKIVSGLLLERIMNEGKPKIPMVEVTLLGKHKQLEAHPDDANYQALLAEWEAESKMRVMRYISVIGVKGQPPQEFIDENREYFPSATANDWKYYWVVSQVPDEDIDVFTNAVMGRSIPTAKGLEQSAESFRS